MKLFNPNLFDPTVFDTGVVKKVFNPAIFQTQPFDTGEPLALPESSGGGGGGAAAVAWRRYDDTALPRDYILATNNLLLMCAGAFIQTIATDAEILHGQGDIQDQRHPLLQ